jgi:serine/threonine-protein kinase HipA
MRAAARAGLRTPEVGLRNFIDADGQAHDCYIVKRYDRSICEDEGEGDTLRVHQEDFCQITSTVSALKYAQDGGPGFRELFQIVRQHTRPSALYQQELIRRMLFNLMIGNQDAHAKNFSVLHQRNGTTLAPAYDLVSTLVYEQLQNRLAMPIGHAWTIDELDAAALNEFQAETGISLRRQSKMLCHFLDKALAAMEHEAQQVKQIAWQDSHATIDRITLIARGHVQMLKQWLGPE